MNKKIHLNCYKCILFFLILLPIYQDSPLSKFMGAAGYTLLMPFIIVFSSIILYKNGRIIKDRYLKDVFLLSGWLLIVSYVAILIWYLSGNSLVIFEEFLPLKAFKVFLQFIFYPIYIMLILICAKKVGIEYIGKYSSYVVLLLTIICTLEKMQIPYAFQSLHFAGEFPYWRVRLLTTEASWTAMMIYIYSSLSLYWELTNHKNKNLIITLICIFVLLVTSESKSLLISIFLTICIYLLFGLRKLTAKKLLIYLAIFCIALILFGSNLFTLFASDIANNTSVATRLYTTIIGIMISFVYPFGVGGAVYLGVYHRYLKTFLMWFKHIPIKFNMTEVELIINSKTDKILTAKSGIVQSGMYWGILGSVFLIRNFMVLSKNILRKNIKLKFFLISCFWTLIILLIFSSNMSFEFWLFYAFLLSLRNKQVNNKNYS